MNRRYAAIDLGTNAARLAIVEVDDSGAWHLIVDERIACRLGEDLGRTGRLRPEAEARALEALGVLTQRSREYRAEHQRAVATYALRTAVNGPEFQRRVRDQLGLELEVLSGEEEARMVLRGARRHAPELPFGELVCLDLGGGSLQLAREAAPTPHVVSLPWGAVLTASELPVPANRDAITALRRDARQELEARAADFAGAATAPFAAGGTVTTAARLRGDTPPLAGKRLTRHELEARLEQLAPLDLEARRHVARLDSDRADIIVSGLAVLCETMQFLQAEALRVHEHGVREGLLLAMIEAK